MLWFHYLFRRLFVRVKWLMPYKLLHALYVLPLWSSSCLTISTNLSFFPSMFLNGLDTFIYSWLSLLFFMRPNTYVITFYRTRVCTRVHVHQIIMIVMFLLPMVPLERESTVIKIRMWSYGGKNHFASIMNSAIFHWHLKATDYPSYSC